MDIGGQTLQKGAFGNKGNSRDVFGILKNINHLTMEMATKKRNKICK